MEKLSKATIRLWMPNKLIKFLKKNGALTLFINEVRREYDRNDLGLKMALLCTEPICSTFVWCDTKQGLKYWSNLNNKYVEEHGNNK